MPLAHARLFKIYIGRFRAARDAVGGDEDWEILPVFSLTRRSPVERLDEGLLIADQKEFDARYRDRVLPNPYLPLVVGAKTGMTLRRQGSSIVIDDDVDGRFAVWWEAAGDPDLQETTLHDLLEIGKKRWRGP